MKNINIIGMKFNKLGNMYDIVIEVLKQNNNKFLIKWTDDINSNLGLAIVEYNNEKKEIKPIFKTYDITPDNLDNTMFNHYLTTE